MLLENNEVVSKNTVFRAVRSQHALIMALLLDKCHKTVVLFTIWVPGLLLSDWSCERRVANAKLISLRAQKGKAMGDSEVEMMLLRCFENG